VNRLTYKPPTHERGGYTIPEYEVLQLVWEEFSGMCQEEIRFNREDCRGTVTESLARKGYYVETPERGVVYEGEIARFHEVVQGIGDQYWARGTATDDLDGNPSSRDSWYWHATHTLNMETVDGPSKVVVDVFKEDEKSSDRDERVHINPYTWQHEHASHPDGDDEDEEVADINSAEDTPIPPIHPFVAVFDLRRHLRLRIHVNFMIRYAYDAALAERLVLPNHLKALVQMLVSTREHVFKDLVRGKSGGAVVLLAGPPGTGKTLTAEVYAESEGRALYSVQCSQLGTDSDALEEALLKVFARARRWQAVLLLDEADVYVHTRGSSLEQNAIVGVFLRVLEYQASVLFLTTNRPDDVDDAIASRCIARLTYPVPTSAEQARIWRVLADSSGAILSDPTIAQIVKSSPELTGRDVKNLLKLAMLVRRGAMIRHGDVEFAKQFKPTGLHK